MIIEQVLLPVRPERHPDFEAAFTEATPLITGMPGFRGLTLSRCVEDDGAYLLLVEWDRLEDHTVGLPRIRRVPGAAPAAAPLLRPRSDGAALRAGGPGASG